MEGRISTLEQNGLVSEDESEPTVKVKDDGLLSKFVEHMKNDERVARTDDGVFLAGVIQEEFEAIKPPTTVQNIVSRLFERALIQHRGQQ